MRRCKRFSRPTAAIPPQNIELPDTPAMAGADPNVRASLRKQLHPGYGEDPLREYRDVTPLSWGERFHHKIFVSREAMRLIEEAVSRR